MTPAPGMARAAASGELVAELFVRALGIVYAIAFASLAMQVVGLLGARGITPAAELLSFAAERLGTGAALWRLPGWLWLTGASDTALRGLCIAGGLCSLAVAAGRWPRAMLLGAWSCYLSLSSVGDVFLSYQWDALLLECGIVGLFVATPGAPLGLAVARALCFKLMLLSGLVKLASGDPTWRDGSALAFHWWTQPLPAWTAVPLSALPSSVQKACTWGTLAIELVAPLACFGPRRARLVACALLAALQLAIALTGSYGFFNLLALALCAALLDDAALLALCPPRLRTQVRAWLEWLARRRLQRTRLGPVSEAEAAPVATPLARPRRALQTGLAVALLGASAGVALERLVPLPRVVQALLAPLAPLRSINSYGLFAVMTTSRREIAVEGSADGVTWRRYAFPWKPDALDRRPRFAAPHMPRLDWQMWFAALGDCEREPWFLAFLQRLLEGSPDVLGLLASNPFPDAPPRFLRTPQAWYRFAARDAQQRGQWWTHQPIEADYCPPVMLRDGQLVRAQLPGPQSDH